MERSTKRLRVSPVCYCALGGCLAHFFSYPCCTLPEELVRLVAPQVELECGKHKSTMWRDIHAELRVNCQQRNDRWNFYKWMAHLEHGHNLFSAAEWEKVIWVQSLVV